MAGLRFSPAIAAIRLKSVFLPNLQEWQELLILLQVELLHIQVFTVILTGVHDHKANKNNVYIVPHN
ncbi:MAG: hypothetical protein J6B31_07230 [Bacteroidaceae bacterium]|nr:hypothetical protein [Bacteroidaceae bacterium]